MAKFSGTVGYATTVEDENRPGIWTEKIIEKRHRGDIIKEYLRVDSSERINANLKISNSISIVADDFSLNNLHNMRYIHYKSVNWDITGIDVDYPRVILAIGGVYNGPLPETT